MQLLTCDLLNVGRLSSKIVDGAGEALVGKSVCIAASAAKAPRRSAPDYAAPENGNFSDKSIHTRLFNRLSSCGFSRYCTRIHARYVRQKAA